jgi:hypothetical protein
MKTIKLFCSSLLVLTGAAGALRGQTFRTDINPALTYYQAFNATPDHSQTDRDYLFTNEWRNRKLPERFGELMAGYDNEFGLLRHAAQSKTPCDWGIDWSGGPETLLGHLPRVKTAAQVARLRAMWDLQHDRQADARQDLLAALALGRNAASDGCLISALVQFAVERIVCAAVAENFNQFTPETLQQLADGFNAPPARGTIAACIALEKKAGGHWLIDRALQLQTENPGNDAKVMEGLNEIFEHSFFSADGPNETNNSWAHIVTAAGGTSTGIISLLRDLDPFYARLQSIEVLPRAAYEEQMQQLSEDIQNSSNPIARELLPAWEKGRPHEFGGQADLAMVQAAVQYKLHGQAGLRSVADPCGHGPFGFQRFIFDGVDRGFELSADYAGIGYPEVFIFVERDGPPFLVFGKRAGQSP